MVTKLLSRETTTCVHEEQLGPIRNGITVGTCSICGQEKQYNQRDPKIVPVVTKLGRIDGALVIPNAGTRLLLSDEEKQELKTARPVARPAAARVTQETQTLEPHPSVKSLPKKEGRLRRKAKQLRKYREENKEALIKDYYSMRIRDFLKKWGMSSSTWTELRGEWNVKGKEKNQPGSIVEKHRWLEKNKQAIIKDINDLGEKETKKKWGIKSATFTGLKRHWGLPILPRGGSAAGRRILKPEKDHKGETGTKLPPFPEFNDSWPEMVQLRWLDTYRSLAGEGRKPWK